MVRAGIRGKAERALREVRAVTEDLGYYWSYYGITNAFIYAIDIGDTWMAYVKSFDFERRLLGIPSIFD